MTKSEIVQLLQEKLYEAEVELSEGDYGENHKYAVAFGMLKGMLTYIIEKSNDSEL